MTTKDELIICRCERVKFGQIQSAIHSCGAQTVNQIKKATRAGMGLCQGRTCAKVIESILASEGDTPAGTEAYRARPPVRAIAAGILAAGDDQFDEPTGPVKVRALHKQDG